MVYIDPAAQKETEDTLREWGLLKDEDCVNFYNMIAPMSMIEKIQSFGLPFMKLVGELYDDFFKLKLKSEDDVRSMINDKDPKSSLLLADTYLRMKKGAEKLGFR